MFRATIALAAFASLGAPAVAQDIAESEPNNPCALAQIIGMPSAWPVVVTGELTLTGGYPPGDVDFFLFQAPEGMRLRAGLRGDTNQPLPLNDPFLGLFDANCNLLDFNDDYLSLNSRLNFEVPAGNDGYFILAASGCCDYGFDGNHGQVGAYRLRVSIPPEPVVAITGRLIDAVFGTPLPGTSPPNSWVELIYCPGGDCSVYATSMPPDEFGVFRFETGINGAPLDPGQYLIRAYAGEYEPAESGPFDAPSGETVDLGDIGLQPPPFTFDNVVPCNDISPTGGRCRYSVDIRNNTDATVMGLGWSLVNAYGGTSPLGYSMFPADSTRHARLAPISTKTLSFSFDVPADVAAGTFMCADAWFSDRDTGYFGTLRSGALFCVMKQQDEFSIVQGKAAAAMLNADIDTRGGRGPTYRRNDQ